MNFERLLLCLSILFLLRLLYQQHRTQIRRLWQRRKGCLPRSWKPKSPGDCSGCQTGITLVPLPDPNSVVPWSPRKSSRGRKKTLDTNGFACPHPIEKLKSVGRSGLIQTAFIERVNLTIRQAVVPLMSKTWSLAQSEHTLLMQVQWWRLYYHFVRDQSS